MTSAVFWAKAKSFIQVSSGAGGSAANANVHSHANDYSHILWPCQEPPCGVIDDSW